MPPSVDPTGEQELALPAREGHTYLIAVAERPIREGTQRRSQRVVDRSGRCRALGGLLWWLMARWQHHGGPGAVTTELCEEPHPTTPGGHGDGISGIDTDSSGRPSAHCSSAASVWRSWNLPVRRSVTHATRSP